MNINDEDYEKISSTALVTSYPRIFTDIPYEKKIYSWLNMHCKQDVVLNKSLAPEIEARYKLTNKLLEKSNIKQVLELAAGYSSRGLIYANRGYNYIEMDLKSVVNNKLNIIDSITTKVPKNLNIINGNALRNTDFKQCDKYFDKNKPIAVINEGLLRYLTFEEKKIVAKNIYNLLSIYGGIWITCDVTPKKFIESQNTAIPGFNENLSNITTRNNLNDRFEDINQMRHFFEDIGLDVKEIHNLIEMKPNLYSINHYGIINEHINQLLKDAIDVVIQIKRKC